MVKEVIDYATSLAIRVIPEFENPGHIGAVGMDPEFKDIIRCIDTVWPSNVVNAYKIHGGPPRGVIDPSYDKTYDFL